MKEDDPCVGVCQFDGRTGWCAGCGRTIPEIRAWRKMTPYRRASLMRELPLRITRAGKVNRARPMSGLPSAS
ncbi:DUF1289 domain-containing protein [Methylobacterium sp. P1-11]|uniref:DUF1289 domain-containing protein n=1 Tax=Methylobacterium sp. P1-11 TaxID=2024616 RepID=UPI0011F008E8|nr:DUF1289 domain-containing protein [Methylobacterium sp. P1-11]KAA0125454.1 DUF1289 domain-containing protein [Methylobacterium sp. P1-11]